jgi:membrane-bound serine protease (ClpP class)
MKRVFSLILLSLFILLSVSTGFAANADVSGRPLILTIKVEGMITPGTAAIIERGVQEASVRNASALILILDTPGGIVDATLKILSVLSSSDVPIITYVTPQGAIAASAGAFILLSGHIAAMSPGTTTGAAMPVTISPAGEGSQAADEKTINFLAGHIRSIAGSNGRPGDVAERFVTENLTLSSADALDLGVVDYIEPDLEALLQTIDGTNIQINNTIVTLEVQNAEIESIESNISEKITHIISNPQITFILLLVGVFGLFIGFGTPGTFLPEVTGAISLVLALFGMGMFEINFFAVVMIVLGIALLIAEIFTPTYGVLGVGGIISITLGIIFLPVEPLVASNWIVQFRLMAIGIGIVASIFLLVVLAGISKLRKLPPKKGFGEFTNEFGIVTEDLDPEGYILVNGELWRARAVNDDISISAGTRVKIIKRQQMIFIVEPAEE